MPNYVIDATGFNDYLGYDHGSEIPDVWISIDIAFDSTFLTAFAASSGDFETFLYQTNGGSVHLGFGIQDQGGGSISWIEYNGAVVHSYGSQTITPMQFYRFEIHFKKNVNPTAPSLDIYVNGTLVGTNSAESFGWQGNSAQVFRIVSPSMGIVFPGHFYFDNFKIGTSQGASDIFSDDFESGISAGWNDTNTVGDANSARISDPGITPYGPVGSNYTESATIASKTSVTSVEHGPYIDLATIKSVTTPNVLIEVPTTVTTNLSLGGSAYVDSNLVATISVDVTGGSTAGGGGTVVSDPDVPGYTVTYSPAGQWGSSDDDDGVIV